MGARLTRSQIFVLIVVSVLALGAWLAWSSLYQRYAIEREDNIALTTVVTATFGKASALKVGTLTGTVQATAADARLNGLLQSDSVMRAPYSVDYMVDLSKLTLRNYRWDRKKRMLIIEAPEPMPGAPNIDEARMTVQRRGIFITRDAMDAMSRIASTRAERIAREVANKPDMIAKARANGRAELAQLIKGPLVAAGLNSVKVEVRFPADGQSGSIERWDESRSLADIYGEIAR
jgi:hypothetical protein